MLKYQCLNLIQYPHLPYIKHKIILKFKTCTYFIVKTCKTLTTIFFSLGTYTYIMYVCYVCMCVFIPPKEWAIIVVGVKWVLVHPGFIALHFTTLSFDVPCDF